MSELYSDAEDRRRTLLRTGALVVVGIVVLVLVGLVVRSLITGKHDANRQVTKISIIPDTPPPPPPPPKEERRPEPPKEAPKTMVEQPKQPDQPQQAETLKMEGAAGDAPSAFGAGAVSKDYVGQPTGAGGGGRMQFTLYSATLQRFLQGELGKHARLRGADYRATIKLWLARDGSLQRYEIATPSGSAEVDEALNKALAGLAAVREPPPENMPQPVKIRVTNRGLG